MKVGRLLLRATVGGFFIGHGTQKLFGWFGGPGLAAQATHFEAIGLKPGKVQAAAAGVAETAGGAALVAGYQVPLASAGIISVMLTAINRVHLKNGPWSSKGGYEYNAVLIAAAASLAETGPGALSLDALRGKEKVGAKWGLFALTTGAAVAAGAHFLTEQRNAKDTAAAPAATSNGAAAEVTPAPPAEPVAAPAKANGKKAAKVETAAEPPAQDQATAAEPAVEPVADAEVVSDADAGTES